MSHYAVKIASGEIVYGVIDKESTDSDMVIINNPMIWEDYETEDGRLGSALVKFITGCSESQVPIAVKSIISMSLLNDAFINFYEVSVEVSKITDEAYQEKLQYMTRKMINLVIDYQNQRHADETGDIVFSPTDSDTTIH